MPESQLVKYSEQKSQDYLTDKTSEGKSFLKNQRTPASLAFKRQPSMKSRCGRKRKQTAVTVSHGIFDLTFRMLQHTSAEVTVTKYDEIKKTKVMVKL